MAKPRNKLADYMTYVGFRLLAMFLHMFGFKANYRTARWLGNLMFKFDRRHRNIALQHLRLSFPDWSQDKVRNVARSSFHHMIYLAFEVMFTTRMVTPARWTQHGRLAPQAESVRLLTERKAGMIYVTGHFGNWERAGYTLAILGFDGYAVARPLDNPYLNKYLLSIRQKKGLTVLDKKGATEGMADILASKRYVTFVADQDAGRKGMFVDFFGRPASTTKAPALVAMQYEVPILVACGRRLEKEYGFELVNERVIHPEEWADKDDPLRWITQEYTTALENIIRRNPEQYLWVHRRWKHRPKGEPAPKGGIA